MDLLRNIPPPDQMHDHFQQRPWFYNIPDNFSGLELAKLDVAPKIGLCYRKGCENQGQCKNLEIVQIVPIL